MDSSGVLAKVLFYYGFIPETTQSKVKIICPFHEDLKPSMQANLETDTYFCFGCNVKGGPIQFIKQVEQCDDLQAYVKLSKILASKDMQEIKVRLEPKISSKQAISEAKHYYYTLPDTDWHEVSKKHYMLKRGFKPSTLNKLKFKENYNHIYGVVAPMMDMDKFKGYVCRATVTSFDDYDIDRKYLYNKGFSRYNTLVGNYNKPWPIITEGFMDYAKLVQFKQTNSAAILGWKITDKQISKIQKYTNCIVSGLDNTGTGDEGTEYLKEYFHVVRFQFPPHIKDIGEMDKYDWNIAWAKTQRKIEKYEKRYKL